MSAPGWVSMKSMQGVIITAAMSLALGGPAAHEAFAAAPPAADRTVPGELIVEPPTLNALGFEWLLSGDANRNATVTIRFRASGSSAWREGLPLLRIGGEETKYLAVDYTAPDMFAGSLFDLEPGTTYEVSLRLSELLMIPGWGILWIHGILMIQGHGCSTAWRSQATVSAPRAGRRSRARCAAAGLIGLQLSWSAPGSGRRAGLDWRG